MDTATSIQDSTNRLPQGDSKSAGFINGDEALMDATNILMKQALAITEQKFKQLLEDKDSENSRLKKQNDELIQRLKEMEVQLEIKMGNMVIPLNPVAPPKREYRFNYVLFPKGNPEVIIDCVIELANRKRELGKYVITSKTDWCIVAKVLHYSKVFIGDEIEFLDNILPNVLPYIEDPGRKKKLSAKPKNIKTIKKDSAMICIPVGKWRKEAIKERERMDEAKQNGDRRANAETILNRCVNIKEYLCNILIHHDVQLENY